MSYITCLSYERGRLHTDVDPDRARQTTTRNDSYLKEVGNRGRWATVRDNENRGGVRRAQWKRPRKPLVFCNPGLGLTSNGTHDPWDSPRPTSPNPDVGGPGTGTALPILRRGSVLPGNTEVRAFSVVLHVKLSRAVKVQF